MTQDARQAAEATGRDAKGVSDQDQKEKARELARMLVFEAPSTLDGNKIVAFCTPRILAALQSAHAAGNAEGRDRANRSRRYSSEQWVCAAKAAMAGDFRNLRNRVELAELPPARAENDETDGSPLLVFDGAKQGTMDAERNDAIRILRQSYVTLAFAFRRLHESARSRDGDICLDLQKVRAEIEKHFKMAGVKL